MKKLFSFAAAALLVCNAAMAQKYDGGLVDRTVALVGNDVVMLSDIEAEAQMMRLRGLAVDRAARCEIFEDNLTSKLFLTQAKLDSLTVNETQVEAALDQRLNEVMTQLGGEAATEEYFGKPLYKLREEWRSTLSDQSLIQQMTGNVQQDIPHLTPRDIRQFVADTPEEDLPVVSTRYRIRQIGLYPDKEAANLAVKEKLIGLRERVLNGEKFSTLARLYSEDPGSVNKGGELGMASKAIFWPVFSDAAMALKEGQVSQVVETPDGFHIIEVIEKKGDMFNARHILLHPQYTSEDQEKAFEKLDSIKTAISDTLISFELAAKFYSQDPASRTNGGQMADPATGSAYFEVDQIKPQDYTAVQDLEVGQISAPIESLDNEGRSGNLVYKIVRLDKVLPAHVATFENDYTELLEQVQQIKREEAINAFVDEKIKVTYIKIDPLFQNCEFSRKGWEEKFTKD